MDTRYTCLGWVIPSARACELSVPAIMPHACVVVCGPSGCGKSTVGKQLADILRAPFLDADDFHSDEAKSALLAVASLAKQIARD